MFAWEITCKSWDGTRHIVAAPTSGIAKSFQHYEANMAGYKIPFVDFVARRAKQFDSLAKTVTGKAVLGWEDKNDHECWGCLSPTGMLERTTR